ncbi:MAG: TolC family outer membrane protein [Gammaproteobacteria bacterium]|nr:TolC family outer membrane protein [Gammaproteobacteria bacterium]
MKPVMLKLLTASALMLGAASLHAEDLLDVYRMAQQSDPTLRAAEAGNQAAQQGRAQSRAALLPQINASANLTQNQRDITGGTNSDYESRGYSISLVQSLYHHDYYQQLKVADAGIAQANAQYEAARQGLILRVAEAYFNLLAAQDNLATAEATQRAIAQQLRQTQQRFEVGLTAITDVHEAQAGYDGAVAAEIAARNGLDIAREALREITGQEPLAPATLQEEMPLLTPDPADIGQWVEKAGSQNLSLIAAEAAARAAAEELSRREAGHYPTLDLVASHGYSDTTDDPTGYEADTTSIGVQLSIPIYSGGRTTAQSREARALYAQAQESLEAQRRATVREVRSAYLGITAGISQVLARKQALSSAQTALQATQAGFEVGTRTAVEVLNAQQVRYGAQRDYARARYDYLLASLRLKQAAGSLSEEDITLVNGWLN